MSNRVFPSFPGLAWPVIRSPIFNTFSKRSVSGMEIRGAYQQYPLYQFTLSHDFLRAYGSTKEVQELIAFYLSCLGSFDSFLYTDPLDNAVTDQTFGVADGVQTEYQLIRTFNGSPFSFAEPIQNVNVLTNIKVDGVDTTDYIISDSGLVSFTTAPGAGFSLTWTGSFYYRCRFKEDSYEFTNTMKDLWEVKKMSFVGAPGNKV